MAKTALLFFLTIVGLRAQTLYWNKPASGLTWATSGNTNWTTTASGTVYQSWVNGSAAVIVAPSASIVMGGSAPITSSLIVQSGATVTGSGSAATGLVVSGASGSSGSGDLILGDNATGNANLRVGFTASATGTGFNGTITVNNFANANSGLALGPDNKLASPPTALTGADANTKIVLNGGNLYVAGGVSGTTAVIGSLAGSGNVALGNVFSSNSGTRLLRIDQSVTTTFSGTIGAATTTQTNNILALTKAGSGRLAITASGSTSAFAGITTVEAGALYLSGIFGHAALGSGLVNQGDFLVKSGATLGLTGTYNVGSAKKITLESGATFDPGTLALNAVGTSTSPGLVFNGSAVVQLTPGVDKVTLTQSSMTGSALGGAGSIAFDFTAATAPVAGTRFDLISFGGITPGIPLDRFTLTPASIAAGWNGSFNYGGDGNTLQFTVGGTVAEMPRILLSDTRLDQIRALAASDPLMAQLLAKLRADAETNLSALAPTYGLSSAGNMLDAFRGYAGRIITAAFLYRLEGDPRFLESARQTMLAVSAFPDWNPNSFLDTSEMGFGVALGYNWLAADLPAQDRSTIRAALAADLLALAPRAYDSNGQGGLSWSAFGNSTKTTNNWNFVCNGGFFVTALTLRNAEPTLSSVVIQNAPNSWPLAMTNYDPDGAWGEGPTYWNYGTSYLVSALAMAQDVLGTDFNLATKPGFNRTLDYGLQVFGPSGICFNFGDGGSMPDYQCSPGMLTWLANRFDGAGDLAEIRRRLDKRIITPPTGSYEQSLPPGTYGRDFVFATLLFPVSPATPPATPPLNWHFRGESDFTVFRSAANDSSALWIGLKGGTNGLSHEHLDLGSFVLDAAGLRWAIDLGSDAYTLPGYFDTAPTGERWTYYRLNNFGHNTLTFNGELQSTTAVAPIVEFNDTPGSAHSIVDLTAAYPGHATSIRRGTTLPNNSYVLVQDDIDGLAAQTAISWHMLTAASITLSPDGRSATLVKSGKTLVGEIMSPDGAQFAVESAQPPSGGGSANPGIVSLAVNLTPTASATRIAIRFYPLIAGGTAPALAPVQPLSLWSAQSAALLPPTSVTSSSAGSAVALNWPASTGAVSYQVSRATVSGGPYTKIAGDLTTTSYTDNSVASGTTYFYVVSASNAFGTSANSPESSITTLSPPVITSPSSTAGTYGVALSFSVSALNAPTAFGAVGLPPGLAIDTMTGLITGTPTAAGSYSVSVQATNGAGSASASLTIAIAQADATIVLDDVNQVYNGAPHSVTASTTPFGLSVAFTYNGSAIAPTSAGNYPVVATIADANYSGTASDTLTIAKASANVALGGLSQTYDGTTKSATVTTTPTGLAAVVTYNGNSSTPSAAGSYVVVATINDANRTGAATATLVIAKATATISLSGLTQVYDGAPKPITTSTTPTGLTVNVIYNGNSTAPTNPGTYTVVATVDDVNSSGSATGTLVISTTALVRHAPAINGGLDGPLQILTGEAMTLNSGAWISGDLLVPGTPIVQLNGQPVYAGTIDGSGSTSPSNYTITLNSSALVRYIVRRTDAIAMPAVAAPPPPIGTRTVWINAAGQSADDFATLRSLTLNSNVGQFVIPAGTYDAFTANSGSGFTLGVDGSGSPAVYNFQSLTLNSGSQIQVVGPVIINLANGTSINGNVGSSAHPAWLTLNVTSGGITLNSGVTFTGYITAPNGTITLNGGSTLTGETASDRLNLNSNALLQEPAH